MHRYYYTSFSIIHHYDVGAFLADNFEAAFFQDFD
jgi:hypothetical protein